MIINGNKVTYLFEILLSWKNRFNHKCVEEVKIIDFHTFPRIYLNNYATIRIFFSKLTMLITIIIIIIFHANYILFFIWLYMYMIF